MTSVEAKLQQVRTRIASACERAHRPVQSVTLLAVTKTFGPQLVRDAYLAGQRAFGENYVQEAIEKIESLSDIRARLEWHLIGPLQSNKTRVVAAKFDWVHSIDRLKLAERLSAQRPSGLAPLNVCLQVNISDEASKSGIGPNEALPLALAVAALPGIRLRGLMAIPEPARCGARIPHRALAGLLQQLNRFGFTLDTLSMGMSADLRRRSPRAQPSSGSAPRSWRADARAPCRLTYWSSFN
jgi:pyridoxal phosphate enzyme (YggS family)